MYVWEIIMHTHTHYTLHLQCVCCRAWEILTLIFSPLYSPRVYWWIRGSAGLGCCCDKCRRGLKLEWSKCHNGHIVSQRNGKKGWRCLFIEMANGDWPEQRHYHFEHSRALPQLRFSGAHNERRCPLYWRSNKLQYCKWSRCQTKRQSFSLITFA